MATFVFDGQKVNVRFKQNKFDIWQYNASCRGKRFRKSTKERDIKKAEKFFQSDLEDIIKKVKGIKEVTLSFEDAWELFLKKPRAVPLLKANRKKYQTVFLDFVAYAEYNGIVSILDVTKKLAESYIYYIREKGNFVKRKNSFEKLSVTTKNLYLASLKTIFKAIVDEEILTTSPFGKIPLLRGAGQESKRQIYTHEELELMKNSSVAKKSYLYPLLRIAPYTGMRKIDICFMESSCVDFEKNEIRYKPIKTARYGTVAIVPIMDEIKDFLLQQDFSNKYLFPVLKEKYRTNGTNISRTFKILAKKLGIETQKKVKGLSRMASIKDIHSFRHNYVTMCAMAGVPMPVVQKQVGHMDAKMTQIYADHVSSADNQRFGKLVSQSLKAKKEKEPEPDKKQALLAKLMELDEKDLERLLSA